MDFDYRRCRRRSTGASASPGADDLGNMLQFKRDFNDYFRGARSVDFSRSINPELQSFDKWLSRNGDKIPVEAPSSS